MIRIVFPATLRKVLLLAISILLAQSHAAAQCTPLSFNHLDANQVDAIIHNSPEYFNDLTSWLGYEVPKGYGRHSAYANSLWIGGLDPMGGLHVAASTYRQGGLDYFVGPYRNAMPYNCGDPITTPSVPKQALWLASGKIMHTYDGGFQVFDPATQTTLQRTFPSPITSCRAAELPNGYILLVNEYYRDAILVDTNGFTLATPDTLPVLYTEIVPYPNGKVLLGGLNGWEEYDPIARTSIPKSNPVHQAHRMGTLLLPNGLVLKAGGNMTDTVELYNPATDTWQAGPVMAGNRINHPSLTLLPGGDVLIAGGGSNGPQITDIYHPSINTITTGPDLPTGIGLHEAYALAANEVLFVSDYTWGLGNPYTFNTVTGEVDYMGLHDCRIPSAFRNGQLLVLHSAFYVNEIYDLATERVRNYRFQKVWKVTRDQVQQFQQDFTNNQVNFAAYPDLESWPGNGNTFLGEDHHLAPFVDTDNDGIYDPLNDGDHPCFIGDQALWWVSHDDGVHGETQGASFPVQIEGMAYAVDCDNTPCPDTALDYTTFYHYEITNKSAQAYHDVYLGSFMDPELGNAVDDYVACDTALNMAIGYNGDANDEVPNGYGLNPPAIGTLLLPNADITRMAGFMSYNNDFSIVGNPETASHYYGYLQGIWKDGNHLVDNGTSGHPNTSSGPLTTYMYPGDPDFCGPGTGAGGWSEVNAGGQPYDRRWIQSFGPLNLAAGQTIELDLAIVWSRAFFNDNLGSVCQLRTDASAILAWWQSLDKDCFNLVLDAPETGIPLPQSLTLHPNPTTGNFTLQLGHSTTRPLPFEIRNLHGQLVYQATVPAGQGHAFVDLSMQPRGIYFLRLPGHPDAGSIKVVLD